MNLSQVYDSNVTQFYASTPESEEATAAPNLSILLLCPIIVLVATGNVLVIMSVCMDRRLRSATNYFLTSLAVADLLVALTVMPPSLAMIANNYVWPMSDDLCGIWVMLDVFFSTSSIMHLCMISLDRYLALSRPFKRSRVPGGSGRFGGPSFGYNGSANFDRRVAAQIVVVWTISLCVAIPIPILGKQDRDNLMIDGVMCAINMQQFATFGSLAAFFLPLVIMFVMYTLTIRMLRKQARAVSGMMVQPQQQRRLSSRRTKSETSGGGELTPGGDPRNSNGTDDDGSVSDSLGSVLLTRGCSSTTGSRYCDRCEGARFKRRSVFCCGVLRPVAKALRQIQAMAGAGGMVGSFGSQEKTSLSKTCKCNGSTPENNNNNGRRRKRDKMSTFLPRKFPSNGRRMNSSFKNRAMASINNEQRASKVLGLIFVLFCLFWCPFFITNVVSRFCPGCDQALMGEFMNWFVWLGYVSSGVNPCVYTMFSKRFRGTFLMLASCRFSEINTRHARKSYLAHRDNASNASFRTFGGGSINGRASVRVKPSGAANSKVGVVEVEVNTHSRNDEDTTASTVYQSGKSPLRRSLVYTNQQVRHLATNKLWRSSWHAATAAVSQRYDLVDDSIAADSAVCSGGGRGKVRRHRSASDVDRKPAIATVECVTIREEDSETSPKKRISPPWLARPESFSTSMTSSSSDDESDWTSSEEERERECVQAATPDEEWSSVYDNVSARRETTNCETCAGQTDDGLDLSHSSCVKRVAALRREDYSTGESFDGCAVLS